MLSLPQENLHKQADEQKCLSAFFLFPCPFFFHCDRKDRGMRDNSRYTIVKPSVDS